MLNCHIVIFDILYHLRYYKNNMMLGSKDILPSMIPQIAPYFISREVYRRILIVSKYQDF